MKQNSLSFKVAGYVFLCAASLLFLFPRLSYSASPPLTCRGQSHDQIKRIFAGQCVTTRGGLPKCPMRATPLDGSCLKKIADAVEKAKGKCQCYFLSFLNKENLDHILTPMDQRDRTRKRGDIFRAYIAEPVRRAIIRGRAEEKAAGMRVMADLEDPLEIARTLIPGLFSANPKVWNYAVDGIAALIDHRTDQGWEIDYYAEKLGKAFRTSREINRNKNWGAKTSYVLRLKRLHYGLTISSGAEKRLCDIKKFNSTYRAFINRNYLTPHGLPLVCSSFVHRARDGSPKTFRIQAKHSGKVLTVVTHKGNSKADGQNVVQWNYNRSKAQQWMLIPIDSGTFSIVAKHSGKALSVTTHIGDGRIDGANIIQWKYDKGAPQRWVLKRVGGGYFKIISVYSGKALAVVTHKGDGQADGQNVVQWGYNGSKAQQWKLVP